LCCGQSQTTYASKEVGILKSVRLQVYFNDSKETIYLSHLDKDSSGLCREVIDEGSISF